MKVAEKSRTAPGWIGASFVLGYCLLAAGKGVLVGNLVQDIYPFLLAFICFLITATFFSVRERRLFSDTPKLKYLWRDIFCLNLTTAVSWLAFYLAVHELEPAIVSAITLGAGPVLTGILIKWLRPQSIVTKEEKTSAVGVFLSLVLLGVISARGESAMQLTSTSQLIAGLIFSLLTGLGIAGNTLYSKRLSDKGLNAKQVMAVRFFLLLAISGIAVLWRGADLEPVLSRWPLVLAIAVFGVVLPLYLLQEGIRLCEPMVVALLLCFTPAFVPFFQIFDPRLHFSWRSALGIILVVAFAALGLGIGKTRKNR